MVDVGEEIDMMIFQTISFWDGMRIPRKMIRDRFKYFFGDTSKKIEDRQEALDVLLNVTSTIQEEMVSRLKSESTYGLLLKLYFIFDEVHSIYLTEKEIRADLVKNNIDNETVIDASVSNRNIQRDIIDACNIWIENCVLYQHDLDVKNLNVKEEFVMDFSLIIDMYLYGFASRAISLLMLSKTIGEENTFYGLEIIQREDTPAEILKYHPYIYFNTVIVGNQNSLVDTPLTRMQMIQTLEKDFLKKPKYSFYCF